MSVVQHHIHSIISIEGIPEEEVANITQSSLLKPILLATSFS